MADEAKQVRAFVKRKISWLTGSGNESAAKATLAKLRRGISKTPGSMPELWEATLKDLPQELIGKGQDPSYGEWAVHTALTLFALHQQGKDLKLQCMNKDGEFLGISLRKLVSDDEEEKRIKRRFDAASTSSSMEEFSHHLRGLIQLLKAKSIPLDYPVLAEDLYWLQLPNVRDSVRLRWGRDFYRPLKSDETNSENEKTGKDEENNGSHDER
jgi:CRISPR system Cascade subunit CasB